MDPKTVFRASYSVNDARGNWNSGSQSGSPPLGFTPTAAAPAGIRNAPAFYWDNTARAQNANDTVPCMTGSIVAPADNLPPAQPALREYGTGETNALTNTTASGMTYWDPTTRPHSGIHQLHVRYHASCSARCPPVTYVGSGTAISFRQPALVQPRQ